MCERKGDATDYVELFISLARLRLGLGTRPVSGIANGSYIYRWAGLWRH